MQVVKKEKFGCDENRCFVITEHYIQDGEDLTPYKSPEYEEITDETDITKFEKFIQDQITTYRADKE